MLISERRLSISTENESTDSNENKNFKQRLISKFIEHEKHVDEMASPENFYSSEEIEDEHYDEDEDYEDEDEEDCHDLYDWSVKAPKVKKVLTPEEKKAEVTKLVRRKIATQTQPQPKVEEVKETVEFKTQLDYKMNLLNERKEKLNPLYKEDPEVTVDLKPYEMIVKQFEVAGIELKLVPKPTQFGTSRASVERDVQNFLMDIRTKLRGQHILIYPGKDTKFEVVDIDTTLHQVVLSVQEPERTLKVTRKVFRHKLNQYINVTNTTVSPSEERRFLIGMDDGHLFACRLKENSNTVTQAHKSLKPAVVKKRGDNYHRQGEWFFVRASGLMNYPERGSRYRQAIFREGRLSIGRGRPHIAEEAITIDGRTYVRGSVKHPDHKTLQFNEWYQVFSNNEKREVVARGLTWFD